MSTRACVRCALGFTSNFYNSTFVLEWQRWLNPSSGFERVAVDRRASIRREGMQDCDPSFICALVEPCVREKPVSSVRERFVCRCATASAQ